MQALILSLLLLGLLVTSGGAIADQSVPTHPFVGLPPLQTDVIHSHNLAYQAMHADLPGRRESAGTR